VVICLERGADLHMAQLMPLPLTVSCFSKIHIGFTSVVPAHLGSPGQRAVKRVCVCVCCYYRLFCNSLFGRILALFFRVVTSLHVVAKLIVGYVLVTCCLISGT